MPTDRILKMFIERGLKSFIRYDDEYERNLDELKNKGAEELIQELKRSNCLGLCGDGGKYLVMIGGYLVAVKLDQPCIGIPIVIVGGVVGLAAEAHFGMRARIASRLLKQQKSNPS